MVEIGKRLNLYEAFMEGRKLPEEEVALTPRPRWIIIQRDKLKGFEDDFLIRMLDINNFIPKSLIVRFKQHTPPVSPIGMVVEQPSTEAEKEARAKEDLGEVV